MARMQYRCSRCRVMHFASTKIGRRHRKFQMKAKKKAKRRVAKRRPKKRVAKRRVKRRKSARRKKRR
ncbi:hypothetical protein A3K72_01315 [Candidatus Woesearchaeota archaeon RBG_13_36_6]|nr:MAG: hypothetical protein A3K72_01315 [Candidatus Woesearchaeota archaeon RBG_13_36_6]